MTAMAAICQRTIATLLYKKNKKAYNSFIKYLIKEDKTTENKDKRNITRNKIINYVLTQSCHIQGRNRKRVKLEYADCISKCE